MSQTNRAGMGQDCANGRWSLRVIKWEISQRVAFVISLPDRVVALHLDRPSELPSALNGPASAVWLRLTDGQGERLDGGVLEAEITAGLAEEYGLTAETIGPDVRSFLDAMAAWGFLVRR